MSTADADGKYDKHVEGLLDLDDMFGDGLAVGDGWCVYGEPEYVEKVADLLGGTFHN